jgi:hypothetical protein
LKNIPIIFPIGLIFILAATFFTGAYAVSEDALNSQDIMANEASRAFSKRGYFAQGQTGSGPFFWYQDMAIFICPLH